MLKECFLHLDLTRDAVALCNHLRIGANSGIKQTARAALRYLLQEEDFIADTEPIVGLQDDAYVLSLAVHEVAGLTDTPISYGAPEITGEEREAAEKQLEQFVEQPLCDDVELIARARQFCLDLRNIAETGYLGRMCRNVEWMIDKLNAPTDTDSLSWIRGALSYLACPGDAIPDDLGVVGYPQLAFSFARRMTISRRLRAILGRPTRFGWCPSLASLTQREYVFGVTMPTISLTL